jgi:hypothetical protein
LLIVAAVLIAAGVLNFGQRLKRETPPWDGVAWVDTKDGVIAETILAESAAARAHMLPGDRLIAVSNSIQYEEIVRAKDVQIYLDQARVGGEIHYLIERPSYPEDSRHYYADLDNLGAIHNWTPRDLYINLIGLVYLFVGFFVLFKQGGRAPFVLHFASLCLAAFVFHFYALRKLPRSRPRGCVSQKCCLHSFPGAVSALLRALSHATALICPATLAYRDSLLARCCTSGDCEFRLLARSACQPSPVPA